MRVSVLRRFGFTFTSTLLNNEHIITLLMSFYTFSSIRATHDHPSGMITCTVCAAGEKFLSGIPSRTSCSPFERLSRSRNAVPRVSATVANPPDVTRGPPTQGKSSSPSSSFATILGRTAGRELPAPMAPRSARSESRGPGFSRFPRSTACRTASRSPLARALLIVATAFLTRR